MVTVTDKKLGVPLAGNSSLIEYWNSELITSADYYPFGMIMQARNAFASTKYRYGYNGKEMENEVQAAGNLLDYGNRLYDPLAGRFWSVDPLTKQYPWYSPYQYAGNNPIANIDIDGLEEGAAIKKSSEEIGKTTLRVAVKEGVEQQAKVVAMKGVEKAVESPGFWSKFLPGLGAVAGRTLGVIGGVFTSDWTPERNRNERPLPTFNPQPEPLPKNKPKDDDEKPVYLFRSMQSDVQGRPLVGESKRLLGVVPQFSGGQEVKNADINVNEDGTVEPLSGGMSASPSIVGLPIHRKPAVFGGTGKDPVFRLNLKKLGPQLMFVPDKPGHGTIQPTTGTSYEEYKKVLENTRNAWEKVEN